MVQSFITKEQVGTPPLRKNVEKEEVNQQLTQNSSRIREPRIVRWREKHGKKRCIAAENCFKFRERSLVQEIQRKDFNSKKLKAFGGSDCSKKIGYHPIPSTFPIPIQHKNGYVQYAPKVQKLKTTPILKKIIIKRKNCILSGKKRAACNGTTKLPHQTCSYSNLSHKFHKKNKKPERKTTKIRGPQIWNGSSPFNCYILRRQKQKFDQQSVYRNDNFQVVFHMIFLATVIGLLKKCWTSTIIERLLVIVEDIGLYVIKEFSMTDAFWLTIICIINFVIAYLNFQKQPKEISLKSEIMPKQLLFKFIRRPVPIFCHEYDTIEVVCEKVVAALSLQKGSFYLCWNGTSLKENKTVGDYGIKSLDEIIVHLRQRSGGMERLPVKQASNITQTNVGKNQLINEQKERLAISKAKVNSLHQHYNSCSFCMNMEDGCLEFRQILRSTPTTSQIFAVIKENNITNNIPKNKDEDPPLKINVNAIIKAFDQLKFETEDIQQNLYVNGFHSKLSNKQPIVNPGS